MTFESEILDFAEAAARSGVSEQANDRAIDAIADCIGCIALGAQQPLERPLRLGLFGTGAESGAAMSMAQLSHAGIANASGSYSEALCLYLGTLAHAADFDDISHPAYCHPTAVLLPPLLIRAAQHGLGGAALLQAYVVGVEVLGQLGRRLNMDHYRRGWHATGTFGPIAATAALAVLEGLPREHSSMALGIAASMAGGLQENFGTPTKPLHAGLAGRSALLATRLARAGFGSSSEALSGPRGFVKVFGGAPGIAEQKPWGDPLEILSENGLAIKAYPSCAATHAAIDATLAALAKFGLSRIDPDLVASIRVGASRYALQPLIHDWPATPLEAKFCMRYCVATALLDGHVGLPSFTENSLSVAGIDAMMGKVHVEVDPRVAEDPEFASVVELNLTDGRRAEVMVEIASGKPGNWLSKTRLREKFILCAAPEPTSAGALYDLVQNLPHQPDTRALQDGIAGLLGAILAANPDATAPLPMDAGTARTTRSRVPD